LKSHGAQFVIQLQKNPVIPQPGRALVQGKAFILHYNLAHGITSMIEDPCRKWTCSETTEIQATAEGELARQKTKKCKGALPSSITAYFGHTKLCFKNDVGSTATEVHW